MVGPSGAAAASTRPLDTTQDASIESVDPEGQDGPSGEEIGAVEEEIQTHTSDHPPVDTNQNTTNLQQESFLPSSPRPDTRVEQQEPPPPAANNGTLDAAVDDFLQKPPLHPLQAVKYRRKLDDETLKTNYMTYIKHLCSRRCIVVGNKRETKCTCLMDLKDDENRLNGCCEFLVEFGKRKQQDRRSKSMDMIRASFTGVSSKRPYLLPTVGSNIIPYPICRNALQEILHIKKAAWDTIDNHIQEGLYEAPPHNSTGKTGVDSNRTMKIDHWAALDTFFKSLEKLAAPRATVLVRLETGIDIRDDDVDLLELPPNMTKRGLYKRYLHTRGYDSETDHKGNYEIKPLEEEDQLEYISWTTFRNYWERHYPHLVIPNARRDICGECFKFSLSSRSYSCLTAVDDPPRRRATRALPLYSTCAQAKNFSKGS